MPKVNIKIGALPLYAIDFFIFMTFISARRLTSPPYLAPNRRLIQFILFFIILSELYAGLLMGTLIKPIYVIIRMTLAGSLFFSVFQIIRDRSSVITIFKAGLLGSFITSALLIGSSLPFSRGLIESTVFSIPLLNPANEGVERVISDYTSATRGASLIGVSILSGAFLNTTWPFLLLIANQKQGISQRWQNGLRIIGVLIPFAIVMTYSRGAVLALFVVFFGVLLFYEGRARSLMVSIVAIAIIVFSTVGWSSEYFFFSRLINRTQIALTNPYEDERETERLYAYTEPWEHLAKNPLFAVIGYGFARAKVQGDGLNDGANAATHAVFAAAYYAYGMLTSLALVFLLIRMLLYTWHKVRKIPNSYGFSYHYSRAAFAALLGFIPWFMLGHAAVSQPRGAMLMFLMYGLVAAQHNMIFSDWNAHQAESSTDHTAFSHQNAIA
jgi:hypothetical protein